MSITRTDYHKAYYESHKQMYQQFYKDNMEFLKTKYTCECGKTLTVAKRTRHLTSMRHQNYNLPTVIQAPDHIT